MDNLRGWVSLAIALLLCVTIAVPMVAEAATPGGIPCNEFRPNELFGILTTDCSEGDTIANELLSEAGTLGVMGRYNQTNDTIAGKFAQFSLNRENMSIDSYAAWSNGALYQVFDTIMFYDATSMTSNINGPIFNGSFDNTNIRIQNHPAGIIDITTEKSIRIKLTMAGGINASPVAADTLNKTFTDAMYVKSENISCVVMVKQGSLEMAGERSIFVDLAKGGEMLLRVASGSSDQQSQPLDEILKGNVLTEYWTITRDDGATYSVIAYDDVDFTSSNYSVRLGSWMLKLPQHITGNVALFHMDKMSLTIAGGAESMLTMNGSQPKQVQDIAQVFAAVKSGSNTPLYYQEVNGNSVNLALFVPSSSTGIVPNDTGGGNGADDQATLNIPTSWLVVGGIVAIGVVAGGALLVKRSRKK